MWLTVFYASCFEHSDKRGIYRVWQGVPYLGERVENLFFLGVELCLPEGEREGRRLVSS